MRPNFILILLLGAMSATFSKYVYIKKVKGWYDAQSYCRTTYTDLAPISSESDMIILKQLGDSFPLIWFGLMRNTTEPNKWMWSGGGEATTFFWDHGQPDPHQYENHGLMINYKWHDAPSTLLGFFFCYRVHAVRERKTWDEALEYCRAHHSDLASVVSETEMMLIQTELRKDVGTEHVWMGLHFLAGDWLWVDRQRLGFEAWGPEGKPECPKVNLACGAIVVNNKPPNAWKAHNCDERLHFVCY